MMSMTMYQTCEFVRRVCGHVGIDKTRIVQGGIDIQIHANQRQKLKDILTEALRIEESNMSRISINILVRQGRKNKKECFWDSKHGWVK